MELSNGFSLVHSASLSIQRFSPSLPIFLLKSGVFKWRIWYLLLITVLLSITSISSHFISTGLVADLGIAPIFGDAIDGQAVYSLNSSKLILLGQYEADFTTSMPSVFPAFGEYSEPFKNAQNIDDTGPIVRAFLPISSATTRQTLSNYTGFGTLLNSRVVCLQPSIQNLTLVSGGGLGEADHPYLTGSISIGSSLLNERLLDDPLSYVLVNYSGSLPPGDGLKLSTNWTNIASNESSWGVFENLNKNLFQTWTICP